MEAEEKTGYKKAYIKEAIRSKWESCPRKRHLYFYMDCPTTKLTLYPHLTEVNSLRIAYSNIKLMLKER